MAKQRRVAWTCALVALQALATGCSDDGEETSSESTATSTAATPSPAGPATGGPFSVRFVGTVQGVAVDAIGTSSRVECVPEDSFPAIHLLEATWSGTGAEQLEHMSVRLVERPVPGDTTDELFDTIFLSMGTLVSVLPDDVRDALPPGVQERPPAEAVQFETPRGAVVSSTPDLRRVLVNDIPVVDDRAAAEGRAPSEGVLTDGEFACPG